MEIPLEEPLPLDILIVESNPAEARLIAEAFRDAGLTSKIQQMYDGEEALSLLRREPPHHGAAASRQSLPLRRSPSTRLRNADKLRVCIVPKRASQPARIAFNGTAFNV